MLDAFSRQTDISAAWGRIFFLYGPGEHPHRLVSSVIRSLLLSEPARCSHGNQLRDYLHVQDVADAFVALLESDFLGPINVASGNPVRVKEIIGIIAEKLDRPDLVQLGALQSPVNDPPVLIADTARLSGEVAWLPKYDLERGLEQTISWWKNQLQV
jgi:nucleoside-diphosphate-sugar epimerase